MIPPVQQLTSPDWVRPSPVQSSPRNFWTGLGPIPNFSGPGINWPGLPWTSPLGPNRPEYAGGYLYTESTNRLINDCSLVICKLPCTPHPSPLATCHSPLTTCHSEFHYLISAGPSDSNCIYSTKVLIWKSWYAWSRCLWILHHGQSNHSV